MATVNFDVDDGYDFDVMWTDLNAKNYGIQYSYRYTWSSDAETRMTLTGSGFTYDDNGTPSGTATQFTLNIGGDRTEVTITGLSLSVAEVAFLLGGSGTPEQKTNLVWHALLAGDDTINLVETKGDQYTVFAGDGAEAGDGQLIDGGDDRLTGEIANGSVMGDVVDVVTTGSLYGGDDFIKVSSRDGAALYGDTTVALGIVAGGDDTIVAGKGIYFVTGDVEQFGASLWGGDDTISLAVAGQAVGDARTINSIAIGGDDAISGSSGADTLSGDAFDIKSYAYARMGNDVVHGNGGADIMYGDWQNLDPQARMRNGGGNDQLFGDAGNDTIFGNIGNDRIEGGSGRDLIDGGKGNDRLSGGAGTDTFVFSTAYGRDTIIDLGNGDKIDVDAWKGINNFKQVNSHATDHGKDVWITLGDDTLVIVGHHRSDLGAADFSL